MAVPKGPLDKIDFKEGLIPAVVQDHKSREVLMVAFMNREALQKSLESGETHFWSRSRKKLWRKGESSGHIQKIKAIYADCDQDTLLVEVEQTGVACHTGRPSCFFQQLSPNGRLKARPASNGPETLPSPSQQPPALEALYRTIMERKRNPSSESYTSRLFDGGIDLILKKVGEEAGEFIISAKNRKKKEIIHETADLLYHLWVALGYYDIQVGEVEALLRRRSSQSGLAEKKGRESKKKSPTGGKRAQTSRK